MLLLHDNATFDEVYPDEIKEVVFFFFIFKCIPQPCFGMRRNDLSNFYIFSAFVERELKFRGLCFYMTAATVVVPVRTLSMVQIDLFKIASFDKNI